MRQLIIGIISATFLIMYNKVFANNELSVLNLVVPYLIGGISVMIVTDKKLKEK